MQLAISTSALLGVRPLNCASRLNCEGELWGAICAGLVEVSIFVLYVRCNMAFAKYIYHNTMQYYLACLYCLDYTFGIYIHSRNYVWIYYIYILLDIYYHIIILCMAITMIIFPYVKKHSDVSNWKRTLVRKRKPMLTPARPWVGHAAYKDFFIDIEHKLCIFISQIDFWISFIVPWFAPWNIDSIYHIMLRNHELSCAVQLCSWIYTLGTIYILVTMYRYTIYIDIRYKLPYYDFMHGNIYV